MALSLATDLGMGQPMEWALRSCLLGVRLGEELGLGNEELTDVYYLALLHYVGCTADSHQTAEMFGDEISALGYFAKMDAGNPQEFAGLVSRHAGWTSTESAPDYAFEAVRQWAKESNLGRCEVAENLAGRMGFGKRIQRSLWQLFERWDGKGLPDGLKEEELALPVRVVQLAQDAETFYRMGDVEAAVTVVQGRSGGAYDPSVAGLFCRSAPRLLASLKEGSAWDAVLAAEPGEQSGLYEEEFDAAARAMADFADLKSPYLTGHSRGVSALAEEAARRCGLPVDAAKAARRAGLLHDLGRVGVPTSIWDKSGSLTEGEWERVRLHPYYTERILARPGALAQLGAMAGLHHERLDGSGYHRGLSAASLSPIDRILAAADAYHAMTEPRPHRKALTPEAAAEKLQEEARAGRIEGESASAVLEAAGHRVRRTRRKLAGGLSEREIEVLQLLSRGLSNRQIAQRLYISPKTVGHHVGRIYSKIGISTRPAATLYAMQHDLLG